MYKCGDCGLEFQTFQAKANHYRWHHLKYAFKTDLIKEKTSKKLSDSNERKFGEMIEETILCEQCKKPFQIIHRKNKSHKKFCSKSCANKNRKRTEESKQKTSESIKLAWKRGKYDTNLYNLKQSQNNRFSSKIERKIRNYFLNTYPEYQWKSGGGLHYKDFRISRDMYSDVLKICFEYDGVWHFKDINNQLEKKQIKDKLLEEWCIKNNYRLIRIDENDYIDFKQLEKLIFERNEPIIKIGKRY